MVYTGKEAAERQEVIHILYDSLNNLARWVVVVVIAEPAESLQSLTIYRQVWLSQIKEHVQVSVSLSGNTGFDPGFVALPLVVSEKLFTLCLWNR